MAIFCFLFSREDYVSVSENSAGGIIHVRTLSLRTALKSSFTHKGKSDKKKKKNHYYNYYFHCTSDSM